MSILKNSRGDLSAGRATIILFVYWSTQVLGWAVVAVAAPGSQASMIVVPTIGGILAIFASIVLVPKALRDLGPAGAAWVLGRPQVLAKALLIGTLVGVCALAFNRLAAPYAGQIRSSPLARMAVSPGLPQTMWVLAGLLIAPVTEELLFRGVFYGGYRRSFGPVWAAVITTLLFIFIHLTEVSHFLPALAGLLGLAGAALACRLRWDAIGPAVAVHIGYNGTIAVTVVYNTWR
jgi:membrane protease YdiL (CAAX protease family)